jgi:23S rRNA U2552 (ribose-2'-O)-methylase RlmE/FtsJ
MREYQKILDRHHNYKYTPEVQKLVDECRARADRRLEEIRKRRLMENEIATTQNV